ncbi:hypothetical protein AVEN_94520-1 [Araneus ventricosus]|uniref:Uncharacterized protein n=1 Tax=Araneus ventricosus TaxID=182803 RepID=A0A4Y2FV94_ARAVE|nr:hypothetical protein AVEN_94520-1 [Araneus ventricosus]
MRQYFVEPIVNEILSLAKTMGLEMGNDIDELVEEHNQELIYKELLDLHCVSQQEVMEESLSEREAALGVIVKRRARFSTGTAVVHVFSDSEKIGWEGPVPCDKLDELSPPVIISKSYLLYDFICGAAINAIILTPLPLGQCLLLEILFCTASGKGNREHC